MEPKAGASVKELCSPYQSDPKQAPYGRNQLLKALPGTTIPTESLMIKHCRLQTDSKPGCSIPRHNLDRSGVSGSPRSLTTMWTAIFPGKYLPCHPQPSHYPSKHGIRSWLCKGSEKEGWSFSFGGWHRYDSYAGSILYLLCLLCNSVMYQETLHPGGWVIVWSTHLWGRLAQFPANRRHSATTQPHNDHILDMENQKSPLILDTSVRNLSPLNSRFQRAKKLKLCEPLPKSTCYLPYFSDI